MKKTLYLLAASLFFCLSIYAQDGDWTNFNYMTTYGDSTYWTATDDFDGFLGSNSFNHPQGILATTNAVFVADTGNDRIVKLGYRKNVIFTPEPSNVWEMYFITEWGTSGSASNELSFPTDLTFGNDGLIYIVDSSNHCIKICDTDGNFKGAFGSQGAGSHQFEAPTGICTVPTNGNLMIADYGNDRVAEFTTSGEFVRVLSIIPNYPNTPQIEDVHYELIFGPYDVVVVGTNLYITEAGRSDANQYKSKSRVKGANDANRFIWVNYEDFDYRDDWNLPESAPGELIGGFTGNVMQGIKGLIDFDGYLLFATADDSQNQYLITDEAGYIIGKFGTDVIGGSVSPSPIESEFAYPYNLAKIDSFVFCADSGNNRISMWKKNSLPIFDYPKTNYFEVRERQVLSFTVHASDGDGDNISYGGALEPTDNDKNWGINSSYMKFSMIPEYDDAGTDFTLNLTASDGQGAATMGVTIHVLPVNPKHKKLVKRKLDSYEDWVAQDKLATDDGDLVKLKIKKTGVIEHWDGSVLEVSGTPTISIKATRSKKLSGQGYNGKMYGEVYATNEYTISSVAQLDEIRSDEELKKISVAGTVGRIILKKDVAPLGTVSIKGGNLGGAEALYIKNIKVLGKKYKDFATGEKLYYGGNITHECYPGGFGRIKAHDVAKTTEFIFGSVELNLSKITKLPVCIFTQYKIQVFDPDMYLKNKLHLPLL